MKWLSMAWIPRSWKNGLILYDLVCLRKKSQLLTGLFPFLPHCLGRQESNITLFFLMRKSVYQSLHPWPPNNAFTHATMKIIGRLVHSFLLNGSDTTPICTEEPVARLWVKATLRHGMLKGFFTNPPHNTEMQDTLQWNTCYFLCTCGCSFRLCEIKLMHALVAYSIVFLIVHSPYWHESWKLKC